MRVLVTGGAGFIGSWLVAELLAANYEVVVLDNLSVQIHGVLPKPELAWIDNGSVDFVRADVRDKEVLNKVLHRCDIVVHLAAETGTGQSMYEISHYYSVNQQATAQLFELIALEHKHIKKIIIASSRSIYGEGAYRNKAGIIIPKPRSASDLAAGNFEPISDDGVSLEVVATPENIGARPASIYAATKLANETMASVISDAYGISIVALRFQNVYGQRQSLKNPYTGILSIFSNRMRVNDSINIFEDGLESRDFVHVSDVVNSIVLSIRSELTGFSAVNVGSGVPSSVIDVAELLRKYLNSESQLCITGDYRVGDIRHCYADISLAKRLLGFEPKISLEQGLRSFCDWVVTQPVSVDQSAKAMSELVRLGLSSGG